MNAETEMATADGLGAEPTLMQQYEGTLTQMRKWIADCGYCGLDYEDALVLLNAAPDDHVLVYVSRHYAGGVVAFLLDGEPS